MSIRNDSIKTKNSVWIGLVGVRPEGKNSLLEGANGAYTNVLAYVSSEDHYCKNVTAALKEKGFLVLEIEDVEPFSERVKRFKIDDELIELSQECEKKKIICAGTFYPFLQEELKADPGTGLKMTRHLRKK